MKRSLLVVGMVAAIIAAWSVGRVHGQNEMKKVVYVSSDQANYTSSVRGVSMAKIWGDAEKGAHATFTKFVPGQDNGMHTHTNDVWIVVLKGAYLYKDDAGEKRSRGRLLTRPRWTQTLERRRRERGRAILC